MLETKDSVLINTLQPTTAGLVCYSIEPRTSTIYILLGKEIKRGMHRGRWCDFGGHVEQGESLEKAAAREFSEESLCTIEMDVAQKYCEKSHARSMPFAHYQSYVEDMLQKQQYTFKLKIVDDTLCWDSQQNQRVTRIYFIKRIPWQPNVVDYFRALRSTLMKMQYMQIEGEPNACLASEEIRAHPALFPVRNGHLIEYKVDASYLEKQQIEMWSMDRLEEVCENGHRYKQQFFRKSFVSALKIIIEKLRSTYMN